MNITIKTINSFSDFITTRTKDGQSFDTFCANIDKQNYGDNMSLIDLFICIDGWLERLDEEYEISTDLWDQLNHTINDQLDQIDDLQSIFRLNNESYSTWLSEWV